jgi:DNA-binding CsgD family transcriptional regulator
MDRSLPVRLPARPPLVGREKELGFLLSEYDHIANGGPGRFVLLAGEPGIGKTRLAEELVAHVRLTGGQAYWARCLDDTGAPAYWPWVQVIRAYARDHSSEQLRQELGFGAADVAQIAAEIGERLGEAAPPPSLQPDHARFRLFDSVTRFLVAASHRQPFLVVLDDLHWLDESSSLLTQFLAREIGSGSLLLLGTYRDADYDRAHPLTRLLGALAPEQLADRLMLQGFSTTEIETFISRALGSQLEAPIGSSLRQATGGNPFFVGEIVRLLAAEGHLHRDRAFDLNHLPVPASVRVAISRRIGYLPARAVELLEIGALIGREFRVALLERVTGWLSADVLAALDPSVANRLVVEVPGAVGRYGFVHALVREALVAEVPPSRRTRLHGQIGEAIEALSSNGAGSHLAEIAHHFTRAAPLGSIDRAVDYAVRAGEEASRMLAFEQAARNFQLALSALDLASESDLGRRCQILLALGDAQQRAGDTSLARSTFQIAADVARALPAADLLAQAALGYGGSVVAAGVCDRNLVSLLDEALQVVDSDEAALRSRLLARKAMELYWTPERDQRAEISQQALELAREVGDPQVLGAALHARRFAIWDPSNLAERISVATELVQLGIATGQPELSLHGYRWRIPDNLESADLHAAETDLSACVALAGERRQPLYHWYASVFRALRAIFEGHLVEAEALVEDAFRLGQRVQPVTAVIYHGAHLFALRKEQGRLSEVEAMLADLADRYPAMPIFAAYTAFAQAERGERGLAARQIARLAEGHLTRIPRDVLWLGTMTILAETCVRIGDERPVAAMYQLLVPFGERIVVHGVPTAFGSLRYYLGLLASVNHRWDLAEEHFLAAEQVNSALGARSAAAWARFGRSELYRERGQGADLDRARTLLLDLARESDAAGFVAIAARSRERLAQLDRLLMPLARPGGLSPRELEVLQLIAAGKSNQEIAETLVISLNTAIRHVSNIFAKIGAANRAEAAVYAAQHGLAPPGGALPTSRT